MRHGSAASGLVLVALAAAAILSAQCGGAADEAAPTPPNDSAAELQQDEQTEEADAIADFDDPWLRARRADEWTGDLDGMIDRGIVRVLTVHSKTNYFLDGARERGLVAEASQALEGLLNKKLRRQRKMVTVLIIPVRRDQLLPFLVQGLGDIASSNLTITDERKKVVDFTRPTFVGVRELVVTGPKGPSPASLDDLGGHEVWVRESSSYYESLTRLNEKLRGRGREEVVIKKVDEKLEDEDILEMVNAGLLPMTVVDSHKLEWLWEQVFASIKVHEDLALTQEGQIASAIRQDSPQLLELLDEFHRTHRVGTTFGNTLVNRYMKDTRWVVDATATAERRKYLAVVDFFKRYGDEYDFDHLMLIAQGYQESKLNQKARSSAGAVGIMQLLPSTAKAKPISIPDIHEVESNIHAGVKYLRFIVDHYFDEPDIDPVNRMLLGFAAYNAGPSRISRLRRQAPEYGFDPNEWFGNMELLVSKKVSREPVRYVGNIYKYYLVYSRLREMSDE
jgi:membrane-bound lytic murein transglycosylase MltF